jgi:hypothetical protein
MSTDLNQVFQQKYSEFCEKLSQVLPELSSQITAAAEISAESRLEKFSEEIVPHCAPSRDGSKNPGTVLPGVVITDALWESLSSATQKAIQEYLTIMTMCCIYSKSREGVDAAENPSAEWTAEFLESWRTKLSSIDFDSISKKFAEILGGLGPDKMPKLPERLFKGHLAKLLDELVREFKPEDFGLSTQELQDLDKAPERAFQFITDVYTKNPELLQKVIQRVANRIQQKIARGEIRPDQIKLEAEELIKEFSGNGAFVEMIEAMRNTFGAMDDPDLARDMGRDGDARRNLVKERLRKKMEAKKAGKK